MKPAARLLQVGFLAFFLPVLISCGSGTNLVPSQSSAESVVLVSLTEHSLKVSGGETHQFAATVTGSTNTSVTWGLTGCTGDPCGSISPSGLYTAPPLISTRVQLSITATAQADPNKVDQAAVELMPIAVSISPAGAWVSPGGTQSFTAVVQYDYRNSGVTWALGPACADNCGTLGDIALTSATYTAPATAPDAPLIKLIATSVSNSGKKAEISITLTATGGMTEGNYVFIWNGWETPITNGFYQTNEAVVAGRFHADTQGHITQGMEDINSISSGIKGLSFTGDYSVGADGRGSFTFITTEGIAAYHMVLDASKKKGKFVRYDALQPDSPIFGAGYFEMQDTSAFSLPVLAGPYAFGMSGTFVGNRLAIVGRFDVGASGTFTGGSVDMTQQMYIGSNSQTTLTRLTLDGSLGAPSASTGRGTATLISWDLWAAYNFAYYVISDQKILLVEIDTRDETTPVLSGEARRQMGSFSLASFNSPVIFSMAGVNRSNYGVSSVNAAVGQMVPGPSGSVTGVYDDNLGATNQPFTGSYGVASDGRAEMNLTRVLGDSDNHVAYFFSPNEAFLMETSGTDVLFGRLRPQTAEPFSEASLTGTYLTHTGPPTSEQVENDCGLTTFDGSGGISSVVDMNNFGNLSHLEFGGTYTVTPNGRGTLIFSSPAVGSAVFWVISQAEIVSVGDVSASYSDFATLLEFEK